ncbi:putative Bromodomain testis-specific protein [Astrocystis sublimbata]|nr:putative Bromodomain testis-specific protein [Astrocystis sublimbata]
MATDGSEDGQVPPAFSWFDPHACFCIILVGENTQPFGIQKDFLIAKSNYFRQYYAERKEQKVEDLIRFPDFDPNVFGLAQLFMFTGTINTAQSLLGYDLLIALWKLGDELGIDGLCEESLKVMSSLWDATNSLPTTELLVKAWTETPEGSPIRALLLSWTAEHIRTSESRAEFTKSLPQEVLSELVVAMSHLNSTPVIQLKPLSSPSSASHKNVHYLENEGEERDVKTTKHRHPDGAIHRVKKTAQRPSTPTAPKPHKAKRSSVNVNDESRFTEEQKLVFCADLLNRMLSGPGFWTRLVGPFREPVRPIEDGVENYFEKVKRPMDLGTIKRKIESGEYSTAEQFKFDIKQIFENCYTYWGREHDMSTAAERFQRSFEEKYADMPKWLAKNIDGVEPV